MIIASDNHAYRRLTPFAPVIRGHKCPAVYSSLQIPPPPHPIWAQSVAPAGWQGRVPRQSRPPCHSAGAAACTHNPCALPPRGRAPYRLGAYNKCPTAYSPATAPALLGMPKAGAMADGAAIAPASPPPTPKGVDFFSNINEILKGLGVAVITGCIQFSQFMVRRTQGLQPWNPCIIN